MIFSFFKIFYISNISNILTIVVVGKRVFGATHRYTIANYSHLSPSINIILNITKDWKRLEKIGKDWGRLGSDCKRLKRLGKIAKDCKRLQKLKKIMKTEKIEKLKDCKN